MEKNKLVFQPMKCLSQDEIRLYLVGELDESARYRVENHLLDCPLCSEAVEGFANEYNFEQDEQLDDLRKAITEKSFSTSLDSKNTYWTINRMAAAILFIIVSSATVVYWTKQNSEKNYLSEVQSSKDLIENVRSAADFPAGDQYQEGFELYRNENYQESLFFFENMLESQPENSIAHYFSGLSALNLGELDKAIENLSYARFNDEKYYEDATWNLALANIGIGNIDEAKALINDLTKIEGGYYSDKAAKLLEKIEGK